MARSKEDKTLVVEKIPADHLRLESITEWFKRFGSVTNVAVDSKAAKALVSFLTHDEAYKAWKSQEAVFGNRFVKVYWHHPLDGQGALGKQALAASADIVKSMNTKEGDPDSSPEDKTKPQSAPSGPSTLKSLSKEQRDDLERNIAQQKVLFSRLKAAQGEEKKSLLLEIRSLSEAMDTTPRPSQTLMGLLHHQSQLPRTRPLSLTSSIRSSIYNKLSKS